MSKSNAAENDVINYILRNVAPSWAGNGNLYLSLHTADPGEGGDQSTNEADYTGYSRVALTRTSSGSFTAASGGASSNNALIQFGNCTVGANTITHVGLGSDSSGAGELIYSGALSSPLNVSVNIQPQFAIGALTVQED